MEFISHVHNSLELCLSCTFPGKVSILEIVGGQSSVLGSSFPRNSMGEVYQTVTAIALSGQGENVPTGGFCGG